MIAPAPAGPGDSGENEEIARAAVYPWAMHWFRRHQRGRTPHPDILTPAEWRVLEHVRLSMPNAEIATRLGVSVHTVKSHVSSMLAKLDLGDRSELAAWDGEPAEASRVALRRFTLAAPFFWIRQLLPGAWVAKGAMTGAAVAVSVAGIVVLYAGVRHATTSDAPQEPAFIATETPLPAEATQEPAATTVPAPELFLTQVIGLRGCDQPVYVRAGGLPPRTMVRLERLDDPTVQLTADTSDVGFLSVQAFGTLTANCEPGITYTFRIVDDATSDELAATKFTVPVLTGRIEIEPASGGCGEIVVTFRDLPPNVPVNLVALPPAPFAHNGFGVIWPPPVTNDDGFARTAPFRPPWNCAEPALSLAAFTVEGVQARQAELLYRIALGPNDPIPGLE